MNTMNFGKHLKQRWSKLIYSGLRLWDDLSFRQGTVIASRYQIQSKLGMGSYGVAYLCLDIAANRLCVLKRMSPLRGGHPRAQRIFDQETTALEQLDHPGIPALYERFRIGRHLCFTMEYFEGISLDELLFHENRAYTEKQSLLIIRKLLHVIEHLHSQGIIHRDIRTANVIVDQEHIRLIDLGLARKLNEEVYDSSDPYDVEEDDPMEKKLRRRVHVTSDFYAIGHLLLFLLYSTYSSKDEKQDSQELGWEQELFIHPHTKKLLRQLLMAEQPIEHIPDIIELIDQITPHLE
ncbi:serine/threonine protein kinase [Paenibacillus sp. UNC451MF]|uniref:serine/threonine protein kinase n=1 Tax=Paenibacillus sp. UNC451MF TaxID=1449063 RepID=UPI00068AA081|nr:protein kinase [Paenibacillus sp. UNC451MF]